MVDALAGMAQVIWKLPLAPAASAPTLHATVPAEPTAGLVPLTPAIKPKKLGLLQGKIGIAVDFDAPLPADFLISGKRA